MATSASEAQCQVHHSFLSKHYNDALSSDAASTVRLYASTMNAWGEVGERFGKLGQYGATLAELGAASPRIAQNSRNATNTFVTYRDGIALTRTIVPYAQLATGSLWWETNDDGSLLYVKVDKHGKKVKDPVTGEYEKASGPYDGVKVRKGILSIIMNVMILVVRTIGVFCWSHTIGAIRLGKHAKRMSAVSMGLWGGVIGIDCYQCIQGVRKAKTKEDRTENAWGAAIDVVDLAALPFDFGWGMTGSLPLAIVGSVLNLASGGLFLAKDLLYYRTPRAAEAA